MWRLSLRVGYPRTTQRDKQLYQRSRRGHGESETENKQSIDDQRAQEQSAPDGNKMYGLEGVFKPTSAAKVLRSCKVPKVLVPKLKG